MSRNDNVLQILDSFLPLMSMENASRHAMVRARVLVLVMITSVVLPLVALGALLFLHVTTGQDYLTGLSITLAELVVIVVLNMLFRASGSLWITAAGFTAFYYLAMTTAVFFTGGWESPVSLMLFMSPIITYLVSGSRNALYAVVTVFMTGMVFLYFYVTGIDCPQIMREENRAYVRGVIWLLSSLIMALLFAVQQGLLDEKRSTR